MINTFIYRYKKNYLVYLIELKKDKDICKIIRNILCIKKYLK